MASIRNLKKDINYLAETVCSDVYTAALLNPELENEKMAQIISDALVLRQEMIERANHPAVDKKDGKAVRKYYRDLKTEIMERVDKMFADLSAAIR